MNQLIRRITSPLYINAFFLMAGTVVSSGLGFIFWMLAARYATPADIGITTAAVASVNLLMAVCDLGLGTTLIRFSTVDREKNSALLNTIIGAGWIGISVITAFFLVGLPFWSPGLLPIRANAALCLVFLSFAAFNHILGLQDAAMLSKGRAYYVFFRNLACNLPSTLIVLPLISLVGGFKSLFIAYSLPNVIVGLIAGLLVLPNSFSGYRFFGLINRHILPKIAPYGLANHAGNIIWGVPGYVLPIIAINALTPQDTGYFYINWTIANFILIAPRMVTYALFAESSQSSQNLRTSSIHSFLLILAFVTPVTILLWFRGDYILRLFGKAYINNSLLHPLLISIVPFTINSIYFVILRVQKQLKQIIFFSALVATSVLICTGLFVHLMHAEGLAMGWLLGHIVGAVAVSVIAIRAFLLKRPEFVEAEQ